MLTLSRRAGERIVVTVGAVEVVVAYLGIRNGQGRIGIEAPSDVLIMREELYSDAERDKRRRA